MTINSQELRRKKRRQRFLSITYENEAVIADNYWICISVRLISISISFLISN